VERMRPPKQEAARKIIKDLAHTRAESYRQSGVLPNSRKIETYYRDIANRHERKLNDGGR